MVNEICENSPIAVTDLRRPRRSIISGTENAGFSEWMPGALWRM